jgi:MFS transporter, DHA1 family, multidrug resistance protein
MRVPPASVAFTLLLSFLVAMPSFGIDMSLPALTAMALVISLLVLGTFAFGLIAPNAMQGAMQPLLQIAGAAGAATGCIQMATGAVVSGLVATLNDEHSALSMTTLVAACSLLGLVSYLLIARPAERVIPS